MPELLDFLNSIAPLSTALKTRLRQIIKEKELARKEYLLRAGKICKNIYYVKRGLLRCYYFNGSREVSACHVKEGDVCIALESFFEQRPGDENIHAVEDTVVQYISYENLQEIYREFPEFNFIGRMLMQKYLLLQNIRLKAMWMQNANDRYRWFLQNQHHLFLRVPGKYLASYLGMTNVMFSRLRSKQ